MSRRPATGQANERSASLSAEQIKAGINRLSKRLSEVEAFDPNKVTDQSNIPEISTLRVAIEESLERTFGSDTSDFSRYRGAAHFDNGPFNMVYQTPIGAVRNSLARSKDRSVALLKQAISSLEERLHELPTADEQGAIPALPGIPKTVFLVHGHDEGAREAVARFIAKIGLEPIILHEQPNRGQTVIEKVEANGGVGFAVVILTPDDFGCKAGEPQQPRARQNVLLELGYFIGRLGRAKVCALKRGQIELPSDFIGVVYQEYDDGGAWRIALSKELQAAGFDVDWNKVMA
jgi:predicted nucleotide-binding protein